MSCMLSPTIKVVSNSKIKYDLQKSAKNEVFWEIGNGPCEQKSSILVSAKSTLCPGAALQHKCSKKTCCRELTVILSQRNGWSNSWKRPVTSMASVSEKLLYRQHKYPLNKQNKMVLLKVNFGGSWLDVSALYAFFVWTCQRFLCVSHVLHWNANNANWKVPFSRTQTQNQTRMM